MNRQGGAALVAALVLMLAVLTLGYASVQAALGDAHSARHERDRQVALRAAEAALLDAERELADTPATAARFGALAGPGFIDGCGKAGSDNQGLCTRVAPPSWQRIDLAGDDPALVEHGNFTLRELPGVAQPPRYLIELIPLDPAHGRFYRITALGFGQRASTRVVLQSLFRKAPAAGTPAAGTTTTVTPVVGPPSTGPPTTLPAGRIGWREVANWPALHAAAAAAPSTP